MSTASFPESEDVGEFYEFYGSRERALEDFRVELELCRRVSQIDKRSFFLTERLAKWFRSPSSSNQDGESKGTNAGRLLLIVSDSVERPNFVPTLLEHMADDDNQCWLRVFAILLQLDLGRIDPDSSAGRAHLGHAKMLNRFFHTGLLDRKLPIGENDLFKEISNTLSMETGEAKEFAQQFWRLQWEFCTRDAFDNAYNRTYGFDKMILPICTIDAVKPGGSGRIFQVEVPVECIPDSLARKITARPYRKDDPQGEYQQFALKVLGNHEDYEQETWAYSAIERTDAMIVQCLGCWEYALSPEETEYHLLLEWGLYDLDDHFALYAPPATGESILQFWKTLLGIFYALRQIHYLEVLHDNRKVRYYGWHGDIKPENLLYCEEGKKQGWKIGDPGFARFTKRDKVLGSDGPPLTVIRGGTMTYGGPERFPDDSVPVSQKFDLWSMGCVLSEAATWIVLGNRGVQQFRHVRIQASGNASADLSLDDSVDDIQGIDQFHNGTEVSHAVRDWHRYLRHAMRKCDPVTCLILDMAEGSLLVANAMDRITSIELVGQMKKIIDAAEAQIAKNAYAVPKAFRVPFKVEQSKETAFLQQSWDVPTNFETRKSVKYKSKRFIDATKDQLGNPPTDIASFVPSVPHFDEMTSQEADDRPVRAVQRRSQTMPKNSGFQSQRSGEGAAAFDLKRVTSPERSGQGSYLTFWDARKLLEKQGWVAGTLELPEEHSERMSPPVRPIPERQGTDALPTRSSSSLDPTSPSLKSSKSKRFSVEGIARKLRPRRKGSTTGEESPQEKLSSLSTSQLADISLSASPSTRRLIEHRRTGSEDHRYTAINHYFDNRDVVFLVDNGPTMAEHWTFTKELLSILVAFLYLQDDNGMELFFTSSKDSHGPFSQPRDFVDAMDKMSPEMSTNNEKTMEPVKEETTETDSTGANDSPPGENDIREVLGHVLGQWRSTYKRKLTLIVLTDGIWPNIGWKRTVANRIVTFLETWDDKSELKKMLRKRGLSIQFIQLGDDPDAKAELEYMDDSLMSSVGMKLPDIIDYEPADGNIRKMILGSIAEEWDNDMATVTTDDAGNALLEGEDKNGDATEGGRQRMQPISPTAAGLETTFLGGAFESAASPLRSRPQSNTWARG